MNFKKHIIIGMGIAGMSIGSLAVTASAADILTGKNGMTLYTFDKDSAGSGTSACYNQCAALWPAAKPGDASGNDLGEISRQDGSKQLTYHGKPLYYFVKDTKAGDKNGDNVKKIWHVVPLGKMKTGDADDRVGGSNGGY